MIDGDLHLNQVRRCRARDVGICVGEFETGKWNAITDVAGVQVGHCTLIRGTGRLVPGQGPVRTGVTAVVPHSGNVFRDKAAASAHVINGFGKCTGLPQLLELGSLETPVLLTNTLSVGMVADACVQWSLERNPDIGISTSTVNPIVGECNDGYLNDIQGRHVHVQHVLAALRTASTGRVPEGAVGAGTGMSAFSYKGGVGSASRRLPDAMGAFTSGVLLVANFGRRTDLLITGVPVGKELSRPNDEPCHGDGSVMVVIATDAPLAPHQLARLARRAVHGLARTGAMSSHGSGDFAIAFSTRNRVEHDPGSLTRSVELVEDNGPVMDSLFRCVVESTEEAVYNALLMADTMQGRDGHISPALPIAEVQTLLQRYGRLSA